MSNDNRQGDNSTSLWGGIILLVAGSMFLLDRLELQVPRWLYSWEMCMIAVGIFIGAKRRFEGSAWIILIVIGTIFLADDIFPFAWNLHRFLWPIVLIAIGLYLITRASGRKRPYPEIVADTTGASPEDMINISSIFCATDRAIITKNLKGGNITTVFGGTELNFMQADIQGTAVIDLVNVFGGIEIVVPSHWEVKLDVATVFGGIEDKRTVPAIPVSGKLLVIKGTCIFGGIDMKSY